MAELYPNHFIGMDKEQIIDHCYYLVEQVNDYIYSDYQDWLMFSKNHTETPLEVMKDSIITHLESEEHYD